MYQVGNYKRSNFTGAGVAVFATPSFSRHSFLASIVRCSAFYIPRTLGGAAQHEHLWYSFSCACAPRIRRNRAVFAASSACGCTSCGPFFFCLRQADKDITFRPQHTPRCRETILCLLASVSPLGSIAKTPHDRRDNTGTAPRTTKLVVTPPPPHSPLANLSLSTSLSEPPKYHRGFREQVEKWPVHPLDIIIDWLGKYPKARVADFGCGEARLAATVPNKVCHGGEVEGGG